MKRIGAAVIALALAAPAGAAGPLDALTEERARIAGAVAALETAAPTEEAIAALAQAMSAYEASLATLRGAVFGAEERERALNLDLQLRRTEIARLLAALQTLSRTPPQPQALHPQGPLGAARAGAMLEWITPELQGEAEVLAGQLREIEVARALRARGLEDIAAGLAELGAARDALTGALARREPPETQIAAAIPDAMLRDAQTLSALADRLAALGSRTVPAAEGPLALRWPVAGRLLRASGEADAAGVRRPGVLVRASPLAAVTAPTAGEVRYAGPFLDYGYVVVLEPRADVLIVLAGLATLETRTGDVVRDGALLGLLGGRALAAQEYLMLGNEGSGETPGETLYIEIRHGTGPVDPAPWFPDRNG